MAIRHAPPHFNDLGKFAFFFDFDGTLADIALLPELAVMDQDTRQALVYLHGLSNGALAIVSGRQISDIDSLTKLPQLAAAGIHGGQLRDASGEVKIHKESVGYIDALHTVLKAKLSNRPAILIERKLLSVALHLRTSPESGEMIQKLAVDVARNYHGLKVLTGKMIVEILPSSFDKGSAIAQFMDDPPFHGRVPIFAGDDITDEDAFEAVNAFSGVSIKIGVEPSQAKFGFDDAVSFRRWLAQIVRTA